MEKNMLALQKRFQFLEQFCEGTLGVHALHIETGKEISFNVDQQFLMCSTYKVPMAIYLLLKSQNNEINLNDLCEVTEHDLRPGIIGTLNQFNYDVGQKISIHSLLRLMMQESCNTSTDILLHKIGGPSAVMNYLNQIDIKNMNVHSYTIEAISAWDGIKDLPKSFTLAEYKKLELAVSPEELIQAREKFKIEIERSKKDTTTSAAMTKLLVKLFKNELIESKLSELLLKIMRGCKRGPARLMGLLPPKTPVAHKTGTLTGYTCDVGIITLPADYGNIAISAYIKNSNKDLINNECVLAEVGRSVYDFILFYNN
jgi:beta-lactamase class A